jgi:hypothetical protein
VITAQANWFVGESKDCASFPLSSEAAQAIRQRKAALLVGLLKEGSPLESVVNSIASALFWFLALAPVLLVPVYYLLLSLK